MENKTTTTTTVLPVNRTYKLREYAIYTDKIRQYTEEMSLEEAVDRAIGSASMRMF